MKMQDGKIGLAKQALQPLANDPHGGRQVDRARDLVALLDQVEEGTILTRSAIQQATSKTPTGASTSASKPTDEEESEPTS